MIEKGSIIIGSGEHFFFLCQRFNSVARSAWPYKGNDCKQVENTFLKLLKYYKNYKYLLIQPLLVVSTGFKIRFTNHYSRQHWKIKPSEMMMREVPIKLSITSRVSPTIRRTWWTDRPMTPPARPKKKNYFHSFIGLVNMTIYKRKFLSVDIFLCL